jgi:hypothetical protein
MISHTRQEWFELAVRGLAGQGWKRSLDPDGTCQMQGIGGRRCAIGHGIRARATRARIDDMDQSDGFSLAFNGVISVEGASVSKAGEFLNSMQDAHDDSEDGVGMRKAFIRFGARRRLTWPADVPREGEIK